MAVLTYSDLQNRVLRSLDEAGDTGTTLAIAKDYIQSAHDTRVTAQPWRFMLWPDVVTFTTTATRYYSLHQEFHRLLWARNRTTKEYLREAPFAALENMGVDWNNDTGSANQFVLTSTQAVQAQPSSASTITIVSSSASDTTSAKAITIRGMTANGVTTESITPTGTTQATGSTSFTHILGITKAAAWAGTLTVTAGATTLLVLFPTEYGRRYTQMEILRTPTVGETLEYRFFRQPSPLSADNDLPDIPHPFAEITVYDALLLMAGYNTELNPQAVRVWKERQAALEEGMQQAFVEAQSLGSEVRYVRYLGDDAATYLPRVIS